MRRLNLSHAGSCDVMLTSASLVRRGGVLDVQPPWAPSRTAVATQRLRNGNDSHETTARAERRVLRKLTRCRRLLADCSRPKQKSLNARRQAYRRRSPALLT